MRSDGGPAFGQEFSEYCRSLGIRHTLSSAYNPASNGSAERGVGQIKGLLERIGRKSVISQDDLNHLVFKLNSNVTAGQARVLLSNVSLVETLELIKWNSSDGSWTMPS